MFERASEILLFPVSRIMYIQWFIEMYAMLCTSDISMRISRISSSRLDSSSSPVRRMPSCSQGRYVPRYRDKADELKEIMNK